MNDKINEGNKPLKLPFLKKRKLSTAEWIYTYRLGLMTTIIVFLTSIIMFISCQIIIQPEFKAVIPINVVDLEVESEEVEKENIEQYEEFVDYESIENARSNSNSELDASLNDNKNLNSTEIYEEAFRVQQDMKNNREAFERGESEIKEMESRQRLHDMKQEIAPKEEDERQTAFVKGNVTVRYSLKNRTDMRLHIPAYECESGGEVSVVITVDRKGIVLTAKAYRATSDADDCVKEMSEKAAMASMFNVSMSAPEEQKGIITYIFAPQD